MVSKGWKWSAGLIVLLFFLFYKIPVIQLDFGESIYYLKKDNFRLKWIHSVEKEEWIEWYERQGQELLLTKTSFKTFGAGVPSSADEVRTEDGYVTMRVDKSFPEMNLTVSENAHTTIESGGKNLLLYEFTEDYESVLISVQYLHFWEYMGGESL
ncbi:DUF1850 domain-containing protein [Oceanobacillus halophilus]|uniref:DUF1850 domain-containing protein n=2 Tax=Oceanobacillus halophilus TaxID=930130 RepID=A0A495A7Y0_9BACI|nr:DUF1850 domain-containing protein [Oceanobacillus halophilus]